MQTRRTPSEILADMRRVGYYVDKNKSPSSTPRQPPYSGPEHLRGCLVTAKPSDDAWKDKEAVRKARAAYNAGTHELVQLTKQGWTWLFSVPRREPAEKRNYFDMSEEIN